MMSNIKDIAIESNAFLNILALQETAESVIIYFYQGSNIENIKIKNNLFQKEKKLVAFT